MHGLVLIIVNMIIYIHAVINYCPYILAIVIPFPSLYIGVEKASLQQVESEIQQNPNAVWCVWIPQPVRITLPACQGLYYECRICSTISCSYNNIYAISFSVATNILSF